MRVLFMGTPAYARTILEALWRARDIEVVGVVSQPDKPVGRTQELTPPSVKESLLLHAPRTPLFQPSTLRDEALVRELVALAPDFIVVAAYGKILPRSILDLAPCINLHASILPHYRGASPIHEALRRGEAWSGVSAMLMEEGLDCGAVLGVRYVEVKREWEVERLFEVLAQAAAELTLKTLARFSTIRPLAQIEADSSHCKKIQKGEGLVRLESALEVWNRYRAYRVWPGIFLESGLKLKSLSLESIEGSHKAGEILQIERGRVVIGCLQGALRIDTLQAPSKKEIDAFSYLNGKRLGVGDTIL